ncbi:MAG: hypothetical protein ISS18_11745 [Bacteroidales bacterium]|nr:hypothetical protein [Bacteroidales bacterium]
MKRLTFLVLIVFGLIGVANAQEEKISNKFGMGFQLNQYQNDFGLGLNMTSPYFAHDKIAVRFRGNFMFNEHVKNNETTWTPYSNISLGLIGVAGKVCDFIRLYGEGGIISLFPSDEFSSEEFVFGGYGLFGFEFYMNSRSNYFIEIGGVGTGATADNITNEPIYSNGLLISTGFRIQF